MKSEGCCIPCAEALEYRRWSIKGRPTRKCQGRLIFNGLAGARVLDQAFPRDARRASTKPPNPINAATLGSGTAVTVYEFKVEPPAVDES